MLTEIIYHPYWINRHKVPGKNTILFYLNRLVVIANKKSNNRVWQWF